MAWELLFIYPALLLKEMWLFSKITELRHRIDRCMHRVVNLARQMRTLNVKLNCRRSNYVDTTSDGRRSTGELVLAVYYTERGLC